MKNFTQESDMVWFMFLTNYSGCYENKYLRGGKNQSRETSVRLYAEIQVSGDDGLD